MTRCSARSISPVLAATFLAAACSAPPTATGSGPSPSIPAAPTEAQDAQTTTVRYEVQDLVRPRNPGADATICLADLAQNVKNVTDPDYWNGEGTAMQLDEAGSITITASRSMQAKVALVLQDMRRVLAQR